MDDVRAVVMRSARVGDQAAVLDEIEEFLTGERRALAADRVLVTVIFTDIVVSTERAARMSDRACSINCGNITNWCARNWRVFAVKKSTLPVTDSSRLSTGRPARCAAPARSAIRSMRLDLDQGPYSLVFFGMACFDSCRGFESRTEGRLLLTVGGIADADRDTGPRSAAG